MKIQILIDCDDIDELQQHLSVIKMQVKKAGSKIADGDPYELPEGSRIEDNNCYGWHAIDVIDPNHDSAHMFNWPKYKPVKTTVNKPVDDTMRLINTIIDWENGKARLYTLERTLKILFTVIRKEAFNKTAGVTDDMRNAAYEGIEDLLQFIINQNFALADYNKLHPLLTERFVIILK